MKVIKIVALSLLSLALLAACYMASAFFLSRITVEAEETSSKRVSIYILTNGVHTDLVMPVKNQIHDWSKEILFKNTIANDSSMKFLAMGWGDKGFYLETPTWADLKVSTAFKATFNLSTSAMHTTFYRYMKEGEDCKKIVISDEQYQRLIDYIEESFKTDENGNFIHIRTTSHYFNYDAFYEANGSYNLFHTCNTWTNNGLKSCGQKAGLWTPFDTGIFYHYKSNY